MGTILLSGIRHDGSMDPIRVDSYERCVGTIDFITLSTHDGVEFSHSGKLSLTNGQSYDHLMIPGTINPHLFQFSVQASAAPIEMFIFEGTTVSANGTTATSFCTNRQINGTNQATVYHAPTVTADGTQIDYFLIPGARQSGGMSGSDKHEWILKTGTNYIIRVTNSSGSAVTLGYDMRWSEPG